MKPLSPKSKGAEHESKGTGPRSGFGPMPGGDITAKGKKNCSLGTKKGKHPDREKVGINSRALANNRGKEKKPATALKKTSLATAGERKKKEEIDRKENDCQPSAGKHSLASGQEKKVA